MSRNAVSSRVADTGIQNLITQSEDITLTPWGTTSVTLAAGLSDPIGGNNACSITPLAVNNSHRVNQTLSQVLVGNQFVMRAYAKPSGYDYFYLGTGNANAGFTFFNISTGVIGTVSTSHTNPTIVSAGNGWYICTVTILSSINSILRYGTCIADNNNVFVADGTSKTFIYAAQANFGTVASTYVKTTTTAFNNTLSFRNPKANRVNVSNRIVVP